MRSIFLGIALLLAVLSGTAPESSAATLTDVRVAAGGVRLVLDRPTAHRAFLLKKPRRLVVDLQDTRIGTGLREWAGYGLRVNGVRAGQYSPDPEPVTRVVVELADGASHLVEREAGGLFIRLEPGGKPLRDALSSEAAAGRLFTGELADGEGRPMNGTFLLRFAWKSWSESVYVGVREGRYSVRLDRARVLPASAAVKVKSPFGTDWRASGGWAKPFPSAP